jgi:hypothetical protein
MGETPGVDDWDGRADRARGATGGEPVTPWLLVLGGLLLTFLGVLLTAGAGAEIIGLAAIAVGGGLTLVGLVALGVMLGIRRQRWVDERRRS